MDQSLRDAAEQGSIDALYALIRTDPNVLKRVNDIPFVDTPLHVAASLGHTQFAIEIMRLMPSFATKLNQDGFTPIHLALQSNQTQVVSRLIAVDEDLVCVQGKEGVTPLHYVVQKENLNLLDKFLKVCPTSVADVTIREETILHIALNNNNLRAFEYIIRWLQWSVIEDAPSLEKQLLNWKDEKGNTVLHIAVSNNQLQVVRWLLKARVRINRKNLDGLTALDILQRQNAIGTSEMEDMLCRAGARASGPKVEPYDAFLKSHAPIYSAYRKAMISIVRQRMNMKNELRSMLLVVVVLFITATYQAALTPPGGVWADDQSSYTFPAKVTSELSSAAHKAGKVIMSKTDFLLLNLTNVTCFVFSTLIILFLIPFNITSYLCFSPMILLYISYVISNSIISPYAILFQYRRFE